MKMIKRIPALLASGAIAFQTIGTVSFAVDNSTKDLYEKIMNSESFTEEEFNKVSGGFRYTMVNKADGIEIDGNSSDWAGYNSMSIPVTDEQYLTYIDGAAPDLTADIKFAYDDENFYFVIVVDDDKYVIDNSAAYWNGDGIQFTISGMDESYGTELGAVYDKDADNTSVFGNFSADQMKKIKVVSSQTGTKTTYECAIPWEVKFPGTGRPDKIKFGFIVNDNDGYGRRGCLRVAPGIAESKTNAQFPVLEFAEQGKTWYGWTENETTALTGDDVNFNSFIINSGDQSKSFKISSTMDDKTESVTVPAHSGIHYNMTKVFTSVDDVGKHSETITIEDSDGNKTVDTCDFDITEKPATIDEAKAILEKEKKQQAHLKELLDECEKKGITTDYESVAYNTMTVAIDNIEQEYIPQNIMTKMFYTERAADEVYEEALKNLEAYLAGEKEPFTVPKYVTSKLKPKGLSNYAMTNNHGVEEERPVFLIGYGAFSPSYNRIPIWNEQFNMNAMETESGTSNTFRNAPEMEGWSLQTFGSPAGSIGADTEVFCEGTSSLKFSMQSPWAPGAFYIAVQEVAVEPGKTYTFKGKAKAENATGAQITADTWANFTSMDGTYDWRDFECKFTAKSGVYSTMINLQIYNTTGGFWLDDLQFIDDETGENLLVNGGMEKNTEIIVFSPHTTIESICERLDNAEKYNISFDVMIAPQYFPDMSKLWPDFIRTTKSFNDYDPNDMRTREMNETHIRLLVRAIKDYKSLATISLTNEPALYITEFGDAYLSPWHDYLRTVYNDDINNLNETYHTEYTSFDEVDLNYNPDDIAKRYDFDTFITQEFARWHQWLADIIHEEAPDIPITTKNMGYVYDHSETHLMTKGMNQQDYAKITDVNSCDADNYLTRLVEPLKKEIWYDYMTGIRYSPIHNLEDHIAWDYDPYYGMDMADYMSQDIWQGAIHGRAWDTIWIWDNAQPALADGCVNYRPDAIWQISKASMDLNRNAYEVEAIQQEPREIGIIYSDASMTYNTVAMHNAYEFYAGSLFNGIKPHIIPDRQLEQMQNYKVVFIANVTYAKKEILDELKKYIDNGGKVIISGTDSLKMNEHNMPNDEELVKYIYDRSEVYEYIGTNSSCSTPGGEGAFKQVKQIAKDLDIPCVDVVDAKTGEDVYKVESNIGVYNGKLIINMENFLEDRDVQVYVNGVKLTNLKDLRDGGTYEDTLTLRQYYPRLFEVEIDTPFIDTFKHWSKDEVKKLADTGIVSGVGNSRFAPDKQITRAEFLTLLMRAAGFEDAEYNNEISDVASDAWYAGTIAKALANGIIDSSDFRPEESIKREEMCTLLVKTYEKLNGEMSEGNVSFTDADSISDVSSVKKAVSKNLFKGMEDGSFAPKANSTRAEAAAVITRFLNN